MFSTLLSHRSRHPVLCSGLPWWAFRCSPGPGWEPTSTVCCTEWWGFWDQRAGHMHNWKTQQHESCICHALLEKNAHPGKKKKKKKKPKHIMSSKGGGWGWNILVFSLITLNYEVEIRILPLWIIISENVHILKRNSNNAYFSVMPLEGRKVNVLHCVILL